MNYRSSRKALLIFLLVTTLCSISACSSASSGTTTSAANPNSATSTATQSVVQKLLLTPNVNQDCAAQVPVSIEDVDALLQETFNPFTGGYPVDPRICDLRGNTTGRQVTVQFVRRDGNDTYWQQTVDGSKQLANMNQHQADYQNFTLPSADAAFSLSYANHGEVIFKKGTDICDVVVSTLAVQSPGKTPATDQAKQLAQLFAKRL